MKIDSWDRLRELGIFHQSTSLHPLLTIFSWLLTINTWGWRKPKPAQESVWDQEISPQCKSWKCYRWLMRPFYTENELYRIYWPVPRVQFTEITLSFFHLILQNVSCIDPCTTINISFIMSLLLLTTTWRHLTLPVSAAHCAHRHNNHIMCLCFVGVLSS